MSTNRARHLAPNLTLALLLASGCQSALNVGGPCGAPRNLSSNGDPCGQQFYFPTGIAVDPDGNVIYVSNGNADLRYSGGTVNAVDADFFECAIKYARAGFAFTGAIPAECKNVSPANLKRILPYDPGSMSGCRQDLNDPQIIECDEAPFLIPTAAVKIGNFSSSIRVQTGGVLLESAKGGACPDGTSPVTLPDPNFVPDGGVPDGGAFPDGGTPLQMCSGLTRRLWLPVRGDPSVTFIDVKKSSDPQTTTFYCSDSNVHDINSPDSCAAQRITVRDFPTASYPGYGCQTDPNACVPLSTEPFGVSLDQGSLDGKPYARLLVSHLSTGEVTLINAGAADPRSTQDQPHPAESVVMDVRTLPFSADSAGRRGAFAIAPRVPGSPRDYWYATSRTNAFLSLFRIADANVILVNNTDTIPLGGGAFTLGNDVRDLAFDPCTPDNPGCRAFFVQNNPPSVFTLDTRTDTQTPPVGVPRDKVVDIVDVCQGPSHLAFRHFAGQGSDGGPIDRVYVVCFGSGQIAVVDPNLAQLVDSILVGRGPNEIAFNFDSDGPNPTMPKPAHKRAYVTNYLDMNVTVVDLDPGSPTENHAIGRIGVTEPPVIQ